MTLQLTPDERNAVWKLLEERPASTGRLSADEVMNAVNAVLARRVGTVCPTCGREA